MMSMVVSFCAGLFSTGFSYLLFNKTETAILVSLMCSMLPKDLHSELILSYLRWMALDLVLSVAWSFGA